MAAAVVVVCAPPQPVRQSRIRESGLTLIELSVAILVLATISSALLMHLSRSCQEVQQDQVRSFAFAKAHAILAEIQAFAREGTRGEAADVDRLDDGAVTSPTLSIALDGEVPIAPDHPLSENRRRGADWLWSRLISVRPVPGASNRNLRQVAVRVYRKDEGGRERPVADIATVVNSLSQHFATTQVYDVYLINVENIPGWWVSMESIGPFVSAVLGELQSRNPGLEFRSHWITKASYGRNATYRPWVNDATDSRVDTPQVYLYPGRMPAGSQTTFYYPPERFRGRVSVDGVERNGFDALRNPYPYALADFFNHAMRYPQELALHEKRVSEVRVRKAAIARAKADRVQPPPPLDDMSEEPTLRLLLEDLNTNPTKYRNAILINLHGELMPFPALRNYSDAAKLPDALPNVRVVTHPEQLRAHRDPAGTGTEPVQLRVYAWTTNPTEYAGPKTMPSNMPIVVEVMDVDLTDGSGGLHAGVEIKNLAGGTPLFGAPVLGVLPIIGTVDYQPLQTAKSSTGLLGADEMFYKAVFVDPGPGQRKFTALYLHHTPVVCPPYNTRGLNANERSRLYGMEYVPSCTESARDFSRNLYATGDGPKNTARWTIRIPPECFKDRRFVTASGSYVDPQADVTLTVRTRILDPRLADPFTSGQMFPVPVAPEDLSETYCWWASSREAVPFTERAQFQGDPRHNPYKDLLAGDPDFPNGYNWFHSTLRDAAENSAADYPGLTTTNLFAHWNAKVALDVPRLCEVLRRGVVESKVIFTTLNGWSFYYLGIGNEVGADAANGYPNSIPVNLKAWGQPGVTGYTNTITTSRTFVRTTKTSPSMWWGIPWLGELYPDSEWVAWWGPDAYGKPNGNLPSGNSTGTFFQAAVDVVYGNAASRYSAFGTTMPRAEQRLAQGGCTAVFNIGTPTATFNHRSVTRNTGLTSIGTQLVSGYGVMMPTTLDINRPFALNVNWNAAPTGFADPVYVGSRSTASIFRSFLTPVTEGEASALVELTNRSATSSGFVLVNGIAESTQVGTALIAKYCVTGALHSYLELGASTNPNAPRLLPLVEIQFPTEATEMTNPTSIDMKFDIRWTRWDGKPYVASLPSGFTQPESDIFYVIRYSGDNGLVWRHVQDGSPAIIGTPPADSGLRILDVNPGGPETYLLDTPPDTFPRGRYLVRVEVYRTDQELHYAWHQTQVFIDR